MFLEVVVFVATGDVRLSTKYSISSVHLWQREALANTPGETPIPTQFTYSLAERILDILPVYST